MSPGPQVLLEVRGFVVLWLPTGRVLLLGRSSAFEPAAAAGAPEEKEGKGNEQNMFKQASCECQTSVSEI